jgi:hypothetical protein
VVVLCASSSHSDHVGHPYTRPGALWFLVQRGELPGDPVGFAVRDRVSLVAGACVVAVLAVATAS